MDTEWFGICVHSRCEFRVRDELEWRGFENFLPVYRVRRRWSDRVKTLEYPVFPGYLFCRFHSGERGRVLRSPGVARILGCGHIPSPVSQEEIDSVRALTTSGVQLARWPYLRAGQRVRIERGPLKGVQGVILRADERTTRLVVSVDLLQRSVAAEVDGAWLVPSH